jgi:CheY-like chemotaxis protein
MNGYEIARKLRARSNGTDFALIAVSGYGNADDVQRGRESGFDAHLVKPVDPVALERALAETRRHVGP